MPAYLRMPKSTHPTWWHELKGFSSLQDLQQEKWNRYKQNHPPREFKPEWMIEPTMMKFIPNGVELWKWSISREKWVMDAEIIWRD